MVKTKKEEKVKIAKKGDIVEVHYIGSFENGEIFDSSEGKEPLKFVIGERKVIKGFEDSVEGMKVGEKKKTTIQSSEAYGDHNPALVQKVPKEYFPKEIELKPGMILGLKHPLTQMPIPATILKVNDKEVTLDLNHPLAGKKLVFEIELVSIS